MEIMDDMTPADYRNRYTKELIVRSVSEVRTQCDTVIIPFITNIPGEVALFASFASYEARFISKDLPTVEELDKFKKRLFIDKDPDWHGL